MKFFVKNFGCAQNTADSERIRFYYLNNGYEEVKNWREADLVIINSCIVRESAENRVYGLINEIDKYNRSKIYDLGFKNKTKKIKIIVTGCLAGLADKSKNKVKLKQLKRDFPTVSEFMPIEKISYDIKPLRKNKDLALIPISFGCSNMCSYCIVPFARGQEKSRKMEDILKEIDEVINQEYKNVMLIGQNVNSYGADFTISPNPSLTRGEDFGYVRMGKKRFKSMFHVLLEEVAKKNLEKISFVSSNPWDFSDELIGIIAKYKNIDRLIHLPFQAGDDEILKRMNRGYTFDEYLELVNKIKIKIPEVRFSTDIIIGFPGEDEKAFQKTVDLCKKVGFEIAYLNKYSPRKGTISAKIYKDDIPMKEKKRRWEILNKLINNY
ncbi:MAG: MiaB/RimO family radical SAM methylthiotransferase [Candidatus Shapirobacteria bacterium]|nr:MiaB/RimO family radical SAM methylthiotransferase [Candidatus Shapirobacteria bacterium]